MDEQTQVMQGQDVPVQEGAQDTPVDLTQAFQMVREHDKKATADAEPDGQPEEGPSTAEPEQQPIESDGGQQYAAPAYTSEDTSGYEYAGGQEDAGGSAGSLPNPNKQVRPSSQALDQQLIMEAIESANKIFKENNIKRMDDNDLYIQHEDGTVEWRNPDNPNKPFDRMEAGKYVDFFNDRIDKAFRKTVAEELSRPKKENAHRYQVIEFAPVYEQMNDTEKEIFDDIIEQYQIYDNNGNVVGFNCNLLTAAQQAVNIAKRFKQSQPQQQQQQAKQKPQPASQPAMDIKTGSGEAGTEEIKTLEQAMAAVQAQKKGAKNG